ncbi:MAG: hypothetical protein HY331_19065 [Chloroflexi bacterium]|nr:hypothetical protein [Chloroflexota bacterium]
MSAPTSVNRTPTIVHAAGPAAPAGWLARLEGRVFLASLLLNLGAALVLTYVWRVGNVDALARTANATYVLFSRDPHLAAIGFVWPPLPSLLQLPILPLLRAIGYPELAAAAVSALAGAGLLALLSALLGSLGLTGRTRLLWLALVQFHPQIWFLSASGLSEIPLMFFLALALLAFLKMPAGVAPATFLGLSLAGAFLVRYEAIGFIAALFVAVGIQRWPPWRNWEAALEGRLLSALAPPVYTIFVWVVLNWMMMGDPLYFQRSVYSLAAAPEIARNTGITHPLHNAMGSLPLTAGYVLTRLAQVNVAFPTLAVLALAIGIWRRDRRLLGALALVGSVFLVSGFQVFTGTLPAFMRYWAYATPFAVVLAGVVVARITSKPWATAVSVGASLLMAAAVVVSTFGLGDPSAGMEERRLSALLRGDTAAETALRASDAYWLQVHDAKILASELDRVSADGPTMIDTESGYAAILWARHPERLVINPDRDFLPLLQNPWGRVKFIAVTTAADPEAVGARDTVGRNFPTLYEGQLAWARLRYQVQGTLRPWRIYEVASKAE